MAGLPDDKQLNLNQVRRDLYIPPLLDDGSDATKRFAMNLNLNTCVKEVIAGHPRLKVIKANGSSALGFDIDPKYIYSEWLIMGARLRFEKQTNDGVFATVYGTAYNDFRRTFNADTDYYVEISIRRSEATKAVVLAHVNNEQVSSTLSITVPSSGVLSVRLGLNCTTPYLVSDANPMDVTISDMYVMTSTSNIDRLGPIFVEEREVDIKTEPNGWSYSETNDNEKEAIKKFLTSPRPDSDPLNPNVISDGKGRVLELDYSGVVDDDILASTVDVTGWRDASSGAKLVIQKKTKSESSNPVTIVPREPANAGTIPGYHTYVPKGNLTDFKVSIWSNDS